MSSFTNPASLPLGGFVPNKIVAVAVATVYGFTFMALGFMLKKFGRLYMIAFPLGLNVLALGYGLRFARVTQYPDSATVFFIEMVIIVITPAVFLASNYTLLPRLAQTLGEDVARDCMVLPIRLFNKIFLTAEIVFATMQLAGGYMLSQPAVAVNGRYLLLAGFVLQFLGLQAFMGLLFMFGKRVRAQFPAVWNSTGVQLGLPAGKSWRTLLYALFASVNLLMIRSNYRLMENWQGPDGYLATHEPFAYVFDSLPVLLSAAVYIAVWPPRYLVEMGGGWKSESTEDLTKPQ